MRDDYIINRIMAKAEAKAKRVVTVSTRIPYKANERQNVVDGARKRHYDGNGKYTKTMYKEVTF